MIEYLAKMESLDNMLTKYDGDKLSQLYLRVFNTDDGQLILRDLANRCYVNRPTEGERTEGMRDVYLSIISRMANAITKEVSNE